MAARSTGSGTLTFGLVSIPFKLYTATSSQSVRFHQLHKECGTRIKYQVYCPHDDRVIERSEIVRGYEYEKDRYVQFTDEELKALEAPKSHNLEILEFVPLESIDFVHVEKSSYVGPGKAGQRAYKLLARVMREADKVAVGRYYTRGKEHLVIIREYRGGLLLHQLYYADEVRSFEDIDLGEEPELKPGEEEMARMLLEQLTEPAFDPAKYRDEFRGRVMNAVEQKVAGEEVTVDSGQESAQIIDLFEALKASLDDSRKSEPASESEAG